jgi:hypothetical protein
MSIAQQIAQQTSLFNDLRTKNADQALIDEAKKKLGELKKSLGGARDAGKKKERLLLKTAKVRNRARARLQIPILICREPATMALGKCSAVNTLNALSKTASPHMEAAV